MELKKVLAMGLGVGTIAAFSFVPALAHNGPATCVLLNSPAEVNNVEMGPPSTPTNPMSKATKGHTGQKVGLGNRFGLYYPVTEPNNTDPANPGGHLQQGPAGNHGLGVLATNGDNFNWRQTGSCSDTGAAYAAKGTAIGYCGRSIGQGTGTIAGHTTIIKWESGGTQLVLTDPSAFGSVNAQAAPPGSPTGSCVDGGASVFAVDGLLAHM